MYLLPSHPTDHGELCLFATPGLLDRPGCGFGDFLLDAHSVPFSKAVDRQAAAIEFFLVLLVLTASSCLTMVSARILSFWNSAINAWTSSSSIKVQVVRIDCVPIFSRNKVILCQESEAHQTLNRKLSCYVFNWIVVAKKAGKLNLNLTSGLFRANDLSKQSVS